MSCPVGRPVGCPINLLVTILIIGIFLALVIPDTYMNCRADDFFSFFFIGDIWLWEPTTIQSMKAKTITDVYQKSNLFINPRCTRVTSLAGIGRYASFTRFIHYIRLYIIQPSSAARLYQLFRAARGCKCNRIDWN